MQRFVHALPLQCCRRVGIAAIATMFLVAAPAALAAFPGRNGKIAIATRFSCGPESNAIAAVNADGTGLRMLSERID